MNETPRRRGAVTRDEIETLAARVDKLAEVQVELTKMQTETHDMVKELHDTLAGKQPGHDRSLLDRMAAATIDIESGRRVGGRIAYWAGLIVAIAGAFGAVVAFLKLGQVPDR